MVGKYNPDIHHRRSIRLRNYDYSQAGAYFVTICAQNKVCLFGGISNGGIILNEAGFMVKTIWNELPIKYANIAIDEFIVMPNHIHGIIVLSGVGAGPSACPDIKQSSKKGQPQGVAPTLSLPDVVHRFKSFTTTQYHIGIEQFKWQPYQGKLWQRNYYEHIIRSEDELNRTREYIIHNPLQWAEDENNPINFKRK